MPKTKINSKLFICPFCRSSNIYPFMSGFIKDNVAVTGYMCPKCLKMVMVYSIVVKRVGRKVIARPWRAEDENGKVYAGKELQELLRKMIERNRKIDEYL